MIHYVGIALFVFGASLAIGVGAGVYLESEDPIDWRDVTIAELVAVGALVLGLKLT